MVKVPERAANVGDRRKAPPTLRGERRADGSTGEGCGLIGPAARHFVARDVGTVTDGETVTPHPATFDGPHAATRHDAARAPDAHRRGRGHCRPPNTSTTATTRREGHGPTTRPHRSHK